MSLLQMIRLKDMIISQEQGFIFSIKKYSIQDGPGIRTTIFFKGCPLRCCWCHNPEGINTETEMLCRHERCIGCGDCISACPHSAIALDGNNFKWDKNKCQLCGTCVEACPAAARELIGQELSLAEVMKAIKQDRIFYDDSGGGVTISGGEPLMQPHFLQAILVNCRQQKIHTAVDTSGYVAPSILRELSDYIDLFLYDLKLMDEDRHRQYTGVSNRQIMNNLQLLSRKNKKVIVRVPIIPGITDDDENILQIADFVASLKTVAQVDLLPYHHQYLSKAEQLGMTSPVTIPAPTPERIAAIVRIFKKFNFHVTIGG